MKLFGNFREGLGVRGFIPHPIGVLAVDKKTLQTVPSASGRSRISAGLIPRVLLNVLHTNVTYLCSCNTGTRNMV